RWAAGRSPISGKWSPATRKRKPRGTARNEGQSRSRGRRRPDANRSNFAAKDARNENAIVDRVGGGGDRAGRNRTGGGRCRRGQGQGRELRHVPWPRRRRDGDGHQDRRGRSREVHSGDERL